MNIIDVYDVASSTWYQQSTSGASPPIRVNPCAVVAAAPDGSSFNIYMYGGQNLVPYDNQTQYSDMWILTIPSFTWIEVDMTGQSQPPARAGHTCNIWDGQIVVVGGYVGTEISCDSPGIYVFNASSLEWSDTFTSLSSTSSSSEDPSAGEGSTVLEGSSGYVVPAAVLSVIGGSPLGGATVTTPAAGSATAGPIATGRPPTYTITQSGSTVVQTSHATSTVSGSAPGRAATSSKSGSNVGTIAAGVVAGVFAALAGYLAFCTWLYRKQLQIYKDHVAMAQRAAFNPSPENWDSNGESGGAGASGRRLNEKAGLGAVLGPFGTDIRNSGSAGRPSVGGSLGPGTETISPLAGLQLAHVDTHGSGKNSQMSASGSGSGSGGGSGNENEDGGLTTGRLYSHVSEGDEYRGAEAEDRGPGSWGRPSTARSSMEDLLGGQEPSFFSVVLNPRRTLRVVNSD
jgi:hypothetical protein